MGRLQCSICGKSFNKPNGLKVHHARVHGKNALSKRKKSQPAKSKPLTQSGKDTVSLFVPCDLAGNSFNVEVTLSIQGTAILPA